MKRAPSALVAIGSFGVAVATLSVAATAAIVILAPQPPPFRISAAESVAALRKADPRFERRVTPGPPTGTRMAMVEGWIAGELRRPARDVRAVMLVEPLRETGVSRLTLPKSKVANSNTLPSSFVIFPSGSKFEPLSVTAADGIRKSLMGLTMPAFAASVRQADGRWLTVTPVRPFLGGWQRNILIALAVSLLLLAPIAWIFARRLTRPFRALAGALEDNCLTVPQGGPRELREAAVAIAAMRDRLAIEASERARILTAIAHDLRTPLTGLRLRIEGTPEPQRAWMVADVERMQGMIDEVLSFARDAAGPAATIDVRHLLGVVVADLACGETIRLIPGGDVSVRVPEPAFRRVVENLLRNTVDYAGGGTITVARDGDQAVLSIIDSGPGIPAGDRERLLRPFERGDASRSRQTGGAGLGLSIVRDFATQHRGSFELADGPGGGTAVILRLPLSQ